MGALTFRVSERGWLICALAGLLVAAVCLAQGWRMPCAGALVGSGLAMLICLRGQAELADALTQLPQPSGASRTPRQMLTSALETLTALEHRISNIHPLTRLPTREQLVAAVTADLERDEDEHLLGLLHLVEADQLAAIDAEAAQVALAALGERLADAVQDRHLVSHIDRATFAVWFRGPQAQAQLQALCHIARQQIALGESVLTPTIACSFARFPDHGRDAQQLIARATADLTSPTSRERADAEPISTEKLRERFSLEQDLLRAIEQNQLSLVFQPVVDAASNRLLGAEALMRWRHPEHGPVSPTRFIPIVERLHLSDRFGIWALNAACREAARWRAEGLGDLRVAVNVSAQQVMDPDLEAKIARTLLRHGLEPRALELELTETAAMADAERTVELFSSLRRRGVGLAIDDFGAGYSSLSYLKRLPFTKLKIDREFVADIDTQPGSRAICGALIELGRGLDLTVLAEGVETRAEVEVLRGLGCSVFQGYYYSRPLSGDDFLSFARHPLRMQAALVQS